MANEIAPIVKHKTKKADLPYKSMSKLLCKGKTIAEILSNGTRKSK